MGYSITFASFSRSISTTEWSLVSDTSAGPDVDTNAGVYEGYIDVAALVAGDEFRIRVYEKARAAGTQRLLEEWFIAGIQGSPLFITGEFLLGAGWDMTILRLAGSDRTIDWSIRQVT